MVNPFAAAAAQSGPQGYRLDDRGTLRRSDGSPMVWVDQPEGGQALVRYTRCTTYIGSLEDTTGLERWRMGLAVAGLQASEALRRELMTGAPRWEVIERAHMAGGSKDAAAHGTRMHLLTELADLGQRPPVDVTPAELAKVRQYRAMLVRYQVSVSAVEQPVVRDDILVHGTLDRLVSFETCCPASHVLDIKTSKDVRKSAVGITQQLAMYASGLRYEGRVDGATRHPKPMCQETGLVAWLPRQGDTCELITVALSPGRAGLALSGQVRAFRRDARKAFGAPRETSSTQLTKES
jgi:hypothetical protein